MDTSIVVESELGLTETTPKKKRRWPAQTGQSGPPLNLTGAKLNPKEKRVLAVLESDANALPLVTLALACFPEEDAKKANSWVRNSLRRLVRGEWVARVGEGTYQITETGRRRMPGASVGVSPTVETAMIAPIAQSA